MVRLVRIVPHEGRDGEAMRRMEARNSRQDTGTRRFIQPVAVAMAFLLFAVLFFGMAMIDLERLEGLIMDALRQKAHYIVEVTEKASQDKFRRLMHTGDEYRSLYTGMAVDDAAFSLQESMVRGLIDVARHVDAQERTADKLSELASAEHVQAIALLDEKGGLVLQSSPLPPDLLHHAGALWDGRENIAVHLFHAGKEPDAASFVGIRRHTGRGAVVLALSREDTEYWGWRIAVQATIEELQWGTGVAYLAVEGRDGRVLAQSGSIPRGEMEECLLAAGAARDGKAHEGQCLRVGDTKYLELSFPFQTDDGTLGVARVGLESQGTDRLLVENRKHIFFWTGLMMLVGMVGMALLYKTQNRHVSKMQAMRERLHHAERLSSLGKLGAGVAHEIRNPLNAISMAAQRLEQDFAPAETEKKERFERISFIIRDEIRRLNGIVEDFLSLSRSNRMDLREQPMAPILDRILFLAREGATARGISVEKRYTDEAPSAAVDAGKMEQALLNIIQNGVESISGEGTVTISCVRQGRDYACIRIGDTGAGIPAGEETRIFDPFYTTKENGVGLGLAIAHEIIVAHGGDVRVESEPGLGAIFEILLPRKNAGK